MNADPTESESTSLENKDLKIANNSLKKDDCFFLQKKIAPFSYLYTAIIHNLTSPRLIIHGFKSKTQRIKNKVRTTPCILE